jgi:hypothetical protein
MNELLTPEEIGKELQTLSESKGFTTARIFREGQNLDRPMSFLAIQDVFRGRRAYTLDTLLKILKVTGIKIKFEI